jgi:hypothetical protein
MKERLLTRATRLVSTPEEFAQRITVELETWARVFRAATSKRNEADTELVRRFVA